MFIYNRNKNQKYDAWLHWSISNKCNINCEYCIREKHYNNEANNEFVTLNPEKIEAVLQTLEKTNKTFRIGLTGSGEPFLTPHIVDLCAKLTKKHFISINTNLTTKNITEFADRVNPENVMFIMASLHIKELEKRNLMDRFLYNFEYCVNKGFHLEASVVGYPPLADEIKYYREKFLSRGLTFRVMPFFGEYNNKTYPEAYSQELVDCFQIKFDDPECNKQKGNMCLAGFAAALIRETGDVCHCYHLLDSVGNIFEEVNLKNNTIQCPKDICIAPFNVYDPYLLEVYKEELRNTSLVG